MKLISLQALRFVVSCGAGLLLLAACSSSESSSSPADGGADAAPTTPCGALEQVCGGCYDAALKQACLTSVVTYKSGGDTGQKACQSAIESGTYDPRVQPSCAKPVNECDTLATSCQGCANTKQKELCLTTVKGGDTSVCHNNASRFEPYTPADEPTGVVEKGSKCCDPKRDDSQMGNACSLM